MSARSEGARNLSNSVTGLINSGFNLASSIVDYKVDQKKREQILNSNKDVLETQYENEVGQLYQTLPESIDFSQYQTRIDSFNQDFISKAKSSGNYDEQTLSWLENEFMPGQAHKNEYALAGVTDYAVNTWLANNANSKANTLAADPNLNVEEASNQYRQYYNRVGLNNIENGANRYGYVTPEEFIEAIRGPKAVQEFKKLSTDPDNGYLNSPAYNKSDMMKKALENTGYKPNSIQEKQFISDCESVLNEINKQRTAEATYAQNSIVSEFATKSLNGETYTADDVIEAARNAGGVRSDGTVDMLWVSFLTPYIEASNKQKQIDQATEKINEELDIVGGLTSEDVMDVAGRVSDGSFSFTPSSVKDVEGKVNVSGAKIPLAKTAAYGAPVISADGIQGTGLKLSANISVQPDGVVTIDGNDTGSKAIETQAGSLYVMSEEPIEELEEYLIAEQDPDAEEKLRKAREEISKQKTLNRNYKMEGADKEETGDFSKPVSIGNQGYIYNLNKETTPFGKDYTPYEGSQEEQLSDIAVQAAELAGMTEGTGFENLFGNDGSINYSGSEGKYTYKFEGMPDIEVLHDPIVKALCQEYGIDFDKDSYSVYKLAEMVSSMENAGAFTDPNKAVAVQELSMQRLNPNITPDDYSAMLMEYKARGILSDTEISSYGLSKHAFAGDLQSTSYNDVLKAGYGRLFTAFCGKSYTTSNVNAINADAAKADQWLTLQKEFERELTLAYQLDSAGMSSDPVGKMGKIVDKLTSNAFSNDLYKALTESYMTIGNIFSGTSDKATLGDRSSISEVLTQYFADGTYGEYLDKNIVRMTNDRYHNVENKDYRPTPGAVKAQIEELAQDTYGTDYASLSLGQKNTLLFSYAYARTRWDFSRSVSDTFGYGMDEIYGDVTVASMDGVGGGFAVVTNDGRVYMSGDSPSGGHNWIIGSVSDRTLKNIKKGATTISLAEISTYGTKNFNDSNMTFTKEGAVLTRPKEFGDVIGEIIGYDFGVKQREGDKVIELSDIYDSVQPGRYNITDISRGPRSN